MKHIVIICLFAFSIVPMLNIPLDEKSEVPLESLNIHTLYISGDEISESPLRINTVEIVTEIARAIDNLEIKEPDTNAKLMAELCDQTEIGKFLGT